MDFNVSKPIGRDIEADFEQLKFTGGYDHNYVTDNYAKGNVRSIATAYCKESGIGMEVSSDCPCVQFYAGNFVKDEKGKNGHVYHERYGFCLETQVEPNAVNVEDFHSPILLPGEGGGAETGGRGGGGGRAGGIKRGARRQCRYVWQKRRMQQHFRKFIPTT